MFREASRTGISILLRMVSSDCILMHSTHLICVHFLTHGSLHSRIWESLMWHDLTLTSLLCNTVVDSVLSVTLQAEHEIAQHVN